MNYRYKVKGLRLNVKRALHGMINVLTSAHIITVRKRKLSRKRRRIVKIRSKWYSLRFVDV